MKFDKRYSAIIYNDIFRYIKLSYNDRYSKIIYIDKFNVKIMWNMFRIINFTPKN